MGCKCKINFCVTINVTRPQNNEFALSHLLSSSPSHSQSSAAQVDIAAVEEVTIQYILLAIFLIICIQVDIAAGEEVTIQYITFLFGNTRRRRDIHQCWFVSSSFLSWSFYIWFICRHKIQYSSISLWLLSPSCFS